MTSLFEAQRWTPSTLSAEELRLWSFVRCNKLLAASHASSTARPLVEDDILSAIARLKESTSAIKKQTELLQSHHSYLSTLKDQGQAKRQREHGVIASIGRRDALELQQLAFEVEEDDQSLGAQYISVFEDISHYSKNIKRDLQNHLREDDQRLQILQELAVKRRLPTDDDTPGRNVPALLEKFIDFTCEEAQHRLDRIYLERLREFQQRDDDELEGFEVQEDFLKEDLNSLSVEIRDVVTMSVSQEFESPLLESERREREQLETSNRVALNFILQNLSDLTQSLEDDAETLESFSSYCVSIAATQVEYTALGTDVNASRENQSLFVPLTEDSCAISAISLPLLRHIGLASGGHPDSQSVSCGLVHKAAKLAQATSHKGPFPDEVLQKTFTADQNGSQVLSDVLWEDKKVGSGPTTIQTTGAYLEDLDGEIARLRQQVEGIDLSKQVRPNTAQEQFLDQWA